jgi:hypothetical protein
MEPLPYRATIFLRPIGLHCGQLELMERSFAKEADAVFWCRVMTEAEPQATGVWFVARSKGGRLLEMTREQGFSAVPGLAPHAADPLAGVLAEAGLAEPVKLELVGAA